MKKKITQFVTKFGGTMAAFAVMVAALQMQPSLHVFGLLISPKNLMRSSSSRSDF